MKKKKSGKRIRYQKKKVVRKPARKANIRKNIPRDIFEMREDEFPGYPYYSSGEDIMNPKNKIEKEELTETSGKLFNFKSRMTVQELREDTMEKPILSFDEESMELVMGTESDVTKEEKQLLDLDELSEDMGEDEELRTRVWAVDMTGQDLDVPGTELDDVDEDAGTEDEENNIYSIGGDRHEGLEEENDCGK